ncbi:hypothetical protein ACQFX9_04625 [Aliinostoc sp. HNIBRCY26]|uniref:hypothetical protein n=1 Tax=Aliinostoc sp. HNIBRCY26 TaxID=3418997 RepID=UPI003D07F7D8
MEEFIKEVAEKGFPAVLLLALMGTTGLTGMAGVTSALLMLGGPFGIAGGAALLSITGLAADMLSRYGLEILLVSIYEQRLQNGESKRNLCQEIRRLPISDGLKRTIEEEINSK